MDTDEALRQKFFSVACHLDEKQRRLLAAAEAKSLGYGGISRIADVTGISRPTITRGVRELQSKRLLAERVRQAGGGRKKAFEKAPSLLTDLEELIEMSSRGDPMLPLRWTCKSTWNLAAELTRRGHVVSHALVSRMLKHLGYSLQANVKTREGGTHPDRDAQFRYIGERTGQRLKVGLPVVSVDTKKKELVGPYKNGGRTYRPRGKPEEVKVHDFVDKQLGKAIPYGVYDLAKNQGWVNVGCDHDTAAFAVESIRRWWVGMGVKEYPKARKLLICADGGGSNGYRVRQWKWELQGLADRTGLEITVCHFPPGTSKWNKIEHRLFSQISMNWRGRPLISHEVIVNLIAATTTKTGLKVKAVLDKGCYQTKVKVTDEQMKTIRLKQHEFHGEWNYTIKPRKLSNL
jgi:transposase